MKRFKRKLGILCTLTLMISSISVTSSFAETSDSIQLDSSNKLDKIALESESYKEMIKKNPNAKLLIRDEMYYKVEIDNSKTDTKSDTKSVTKTAYTPEEYKAELLKEQSNDITTNSLSLSKNYGWINVAIYGWYDSQEKWFIEFTYNWEKTPSWQSTDAIVLGADSNLPIYTDTIKAYHTVTTNRQTYDYSYDWSTPDMKSRGANTYGINVPLNVGATYTDESTQDAHGYISAYCTRANTTTKSGKIFGSYGHREIGINPSLSFSFSSTSLGFGFSFGITSDDAPISKVFNLFDS